MQSMVTFDNYSVALTKKVCFFCLVHFILFDIKQASLPSSIAERALARDKGCIFIGVSPTGNSDTLVATWIFPPFLGYTVSTDNTYAAIVRLISLNSWWLQVSDDPWIARTYHDNPDACDFSKFMVVTNTVSGRQDVVALFYENKLGIDVDVCIHEILTISFVFLILVQDNYHIIIFDGSTLKRCHLIKKPCHLCCWSGWQDRPSDRYLRLHFQRCLTVSTCGGNPTEDYKDQEINVFMEELGVYDDEMDTTDPRWTTSKSMPILLGKRWRSESFLYI